MKDIISSPVYNTLFDFFEILSLYGNQALF
jgi:hypothetical protein